MLCGRIVRGSRLKNRSVATISNNTLDYQTFLQQRGKISKLPGVFLSSFSRRQMSSIKESFLCSLSHHNGDYASSTSSIFINKNNVLMSQSSFALCRKYYVTGISSTTSQTRLIHYNENFSSLNHLKVFVFPFTLYFTFTYFATLTVSYVETLCYHKQSHVPNANIDKKTHWRLFKVKIERFVVFHTDEWNEHRIEIKWAREYKKLWTSWDARRGSKVKSAEIFFIVRIISVFLSTLLLFF